MGTLVVRGPLGNLHLELPADLYFVCPERAIYHFHEAIKSPRGGGKKRMIKQYIPSH